MFNLLERFTAIAGLSKVLYNFYLRTCNLIFLMVNSIFRVKFPLLCYFLRISVQARDVTIEMKNIAELTTTHGFTFTPWYKQKALRHNAYGPHFNHF